jgi:hypothetical protein
MFEEKKLTDDKYLRMLTSPRGASAEGARSEAKLFARIPGFAGVWDAHQIFWETHRTWPFAALIAGLSQP